MALNNLPNEIAIIDDKYKVLYFDDISDVCIMGRYDKLKEVDFWTNEIRIFRKDSTEFEMWNRIWESLVNIFIHKLHIDDIVDDELEKDHIVLLATGIGDVLLNNILLNNRTKFPESVQIFDSVYSVKYLDKASRVDNEQRTSLFGQVDGWNCTIRAYKSKYSENGIWQTIWHEIIHVILDKLRLKLSDNETFVDLMAMAINDIFTHNQNFKQRFEK